MAFHLEKRWKKLFSSALYRSKTLLSTKVKFSQMTSNDIEKFKQEVSFALLIEKWRNNISTERKKIDDENFISSTLCIHISTSLGLPLIRKNIVKVLLNILSMKPFWSFKTFQWNMDGVRECLIYWITNRQMYTQTHIVLDSVGLFNHLKHKLLAMCDETRRPIQSRPIICLSSDIDSNFNWISLVSLRSIASNSHNINRHWNCISCDLVSNSSMSLLNLVFENAST